MIHSPQSVLCPSRKYCFPFPLCIIHPKNLLALPFLGCINSPQSSIPSSFFGGPPQPEIYLSLLKGQLWHHRVNQVRQQGVTSGLRAADGVSLDSDQQGLLPMQPAIREKKRGEIKHTHTHTPHSGWNKGRLQQFIFSLNPLLYPLKQSFLRRKLLQSHKLNNHHKNIFFKNRSKSLHKRKIKQDYWLCISFLKFTSS